MPVLRKDRVDFSAERSASATMGAPTDLDLEVCLLPALTERLEHALDLAVSDDALAQMERVSALCSEAQVLAAAAGLLRASGKVAD